jgi:hypothetical protein
MRPLHVVASIPGGIALPHGPMALDGILAATEARRLGLPSAMTEDEVVPIEIPVAREPGGRFHLCSFSLGEFEEHDLHWINRRYPIPEAQAMAGAKFKRIQISSGPCKSYRLPLEVGYLKGAKLEWYCVGDEQSICELLSGVTHVGKKRGVGNGEVREWKVEECEPWEGGFPVVRDGVPLRTLPVDWPGVGQDADRAYATLTYPYWLHTREKLYVVPRSCD